MGVMVAASGNAQVEGAVQLLPQLAMTADNRLYALDSSRAADVGRGDAGSASPWASRASHVRSARCRSRRAVISAPHSRELFRSSVAVVRIPERCRALLSWRRSVAFQDVGGHFFVMGQHFGPGKACVMSITGRVKLTSGNTFPFPMVRSKPQFTGFGEKPKSEVFRARHSQECGKY